MFGCIQDLFPAADNRDAVHIAAPFVRIVVNDADNFIRYFMSAGYFAKNGLRRIPGANEHDASGIFVRCFAPAFQDLDKAEGETDTEEQDPLHDSTEEIIRKRHTLQEESNQDSMKGRRNKRAQHRTNKFGKACKPPHAVVHAEDEKDNDTDSRTGNDKGVVSIDVLKFNPAINAVKPQPQGQEIGSTDGNEVIDHQEHGNNLPVLNLFAADPDAQHLSRRFRVSGAQKVLLLEQAKRKGRSFSFHLVYAVNLLI